MQANDSLGIRSHLATSVNSARACLVSLSSVGKQLGSIPKLDNLLVCYWGLGVE